MKKILSIILLGMLYLHGQAQWPSKVFTPVQFDNVKFGKKLIFPVDTFPLTLKDTGAIAAKGSRLYIARKIGNLIRWDTLAGGGGGGLESVAADQFTILGNGVSTPLTAPGIEARFGSVAALRTGGAGLTLNTYVQTNGYYSPFDGGAARYLITSDTIAGLKVDTAAFIKLATGKYARIAHTGTLLLSQFGAVGNGTANDYPAFKKINDYARRDRNVQTIQGKNGATYRLRLTSAVVDDAFIIVNYSGITWDGNGAKVIYDNNATQSYVYYTIGGVKGIYRAKESHIGTNAHLPNKTLYWGEQHWQLVQDNVNTSGQYPTWAAGVQYNGAHHFALIGTEATTFSANPNTTPIVSGVTFRNWEITAGESDELSTGIGYWNIRAKAFYLQDGIDNITMENLNVHHVLSELIYGNGLLSVKRINIRNSNLAYASNGVSSAGELLMENNTVTHLAGNAYESTPLTYKQTVRNNTISYCENGVTIGGAGDDINPYSDAIVEGNRIFNCINYGVFATRRLRGGRIINNTIYDNGYGIGIIQQSSTYADAVSDLQVSGNFIGAYHLNNGYGIYMSSDHSIDTIRTANITISNNTFGKVEAAYTEGLDNNLSSCIFVYGDKFKKIVVSENKNLFANGVVPFIQRDPTAASVPINLGSNLVNGYFEGNAIKSELSELGGLTFLRDGIGGNSGLSDAYYPAAKGLRMGAQGFDGSTFQLFSGTHPDLPGHSYFDFGSSTRNLTGAALNFRSLSSTGGVKTVLKFNLNGAMSLPQYAGNDGKFLSFNNFGDIVAVNAPAGGTSITDYITNTTPETVTGAKNFSGTANPLKVTTSANSAKPLILDHIGGDGFQDNFITWRNYGVDRFNFGDYQGKLMVHTNSLGATQEWDGNGGIRFPYIVNGLLQSDGTGNVTATTAYSTTAQMNAAILADTGNIWVVGTNNVTASKINDTLRVSGMNYNTDQFSVADGTVHLKYGAELVTQFNTETYTVTANIGSIFLNNGASPSNSGVTPTAVNLPDPTTCPHRVIKIRNGTGGTITLNYSIIWQNGAPARGTLGMDRSIEIQSNGSVWVQISSNFNGS